MSANGVRGTVLDLVDRNATAHAGMTAMIDNGTVLSWSQYRQRARAVALALLELGLERGEVVGLHMVNRAEHVLADVGVLMAGGVPTSFYLGLTADQLYYLARDCAASVIIVDADQLPLWQQVRPRLPWLRQIVVLDADDDDPLSAGVLRFERWIDDADHKLAKRGALVDASRAQVKADDVLAIVYTSGTTGQPKGVILTHTNARWMVEEVARQIGEHLGGAVGWSSISYLPFAHVAERLFSYYFALTSTVTVTFVRDVNQMSAVLPVARPYLYFGPPAVWEKIYSSVRAQMATATNPANRVLGRWSVQVAQSMGRKTFGQRAPSMMSRMLHPIMNRLVYEKLRVALGMDRVVFAVSGTSSLSPEVMTFFAGIGITIIEIFGPTESGMVTMSPLDAPRIGTVGRSMAGVELKIASDGEILVSSPAVAPGYLRRAGGVSEILDSDGWLRTGDLGELDDDGYLRLYGRKQELITTSTGIEISPGYVESTLTSGSTLIGSVFVYGDRKPGLVALITLNPDTWQDWCMANGVVMESTNQALYNPKARSEIVRAIKASNELLPEGGQIRDWVLLEEHWSYETGELTPTMKLRRSVILDRYREEILRLYAGLPALEQES
ncbi:AMP-dependent synthetase/ligase [Pseudonocardia spinosispora]|uniref:AMP-dependent synthetase/ligase n=1 Tax=Pseudonocardia spinosispora TaxID=103441 RepID=UPI0012EC2F95|nr:AMP-binding protein [Pseudonocardia spinosispora]